MRRFHLDWFTIGRGRERKSRGALRLRPTRCCNIIVSPAAIKRLPLANRADKWLVCLRRAFRRAEDCGDGVCLRLAGSKAPINSEHGSRTVVRLAKKEKDLSIPAYSQFLAPQGREIFFSAPVGETIRNTRVEYPGTQQAVITICRSVSRIPFSPDRGVHRERLIETLAFPFTRHCCSFCDDLLYTCGHRSLTSACVTRLSQTILKAALWKYWPSRFSPRDSAADSVQFPMLDHFIPCDYLLLANS